MFFVVLESMFSRMQGPGGIGRSWSIRSHLWLFGLILALPLAVWATFLILEIGRTVRHETEQRMMQVAAGIAADIDRDLQRRITILQTLATSATLGQGNLSAFHARAQVAAKQAKAGIFLVDPAFRQLLNTNVPFGTPLPDYGTPETALRTFQTKSPQVSSFFIGRVIQRPVFDLDIPVIIGDEVPYVLAMGLEPSLLGEILRGQQLPPDWILNVADTTGTVIARSSESSNYVGRTLQSGLMSQPADAVIHTVGMDGANVLRAVAHSRIAGWQVAVNVPLTVAQAQLRRSYLLLGLWTAAALLLTALLASWFANRMAHPIATAARAAAGLVRREPIAAVASGITEANDLMAALKHTADELAEAEKQRTLAEEQQRHASAELAERVQRQVALYQFVDRLHRAKSPSEIHEAGLDTVLQALRCDRAAVLLFDTAGVMRFVAWRGLSDAYRRAVDGHSPWSGGEVDPPPIFVPDVAAADLDEGLKAVVRSEGVAALAFIPLTANGKLIGKFMTYYNAPHVFGDDEAGLSSNIANQLALAIHRKRADETEKLLLAELQHRTKNLFAVVHALALRTFRGNHALDEARDAFVGRLSAMARTYDWLTNTAWKGISLSDLVRSELEPFTARTKIEGSEIILVPQAAQNFALALHELATNAAKYGALSKPDGDVAIGWTVVNGNGREVLKFRWRENGGPPATEPMRDGFGTSLLKVTLGEARIQYAPDGLIYEVELPLDGIVTSTDRAAQEPGARDLHPLGES